MAEENTPWKIGDYEMIAEEIADIIWLASFVDSVQQPAQATVPDSTTKEQASPAGKDLPLPKKREPAGGGKEQKHRKQETKKAPGKKSDGEGRSGKLFLPDYGATAMNTSMSGLAFPTPRPESVLEKLPVVRSLRPLLRRIPSRTEFVLDEEATVEQIAEAGDGGWMPVLQPLKERPFDLVLLFDRSPSMVIWESTVKEIRTLLVQTGIFRNVHACSMMMEEKQIEEKEAPQVEMTLQVAFPSSETAGRNYHPKELVDPLQRRLVLVLSDCNSAAWENGAAMEILQPLANVNLVTILQLLPECLWETTALTNAVHGYVSANEAVFTNKQLVVESLQSGWNKEELAEYRPVPVVSFSPEALSRWAHFITGRKQERLLAYFFLPREAGPDLELEAELDALEGVIPFREPTLEDRFRQFLGTVPPVSRKLASFLAAVPLSLPIMQLVRKTMLPQSTHLDFVQFFYSGIIERKTLPGKQYSGDQLLYEFVGGEEMRRKLLSGLPRYRIEEVLDKVYQAVSGYIRERVDQFDVFDSIIHIPGYEGTVKMDAKSQHFAEVSIGVLRHLGGIYNAMADQLEESMAKVGHRQTEEEGMEVYLEVHLPERVTVGEDFVARVTFSQNAGSEAASGDSRQLLGAFQPHKSLIVRVEDTQGAVVAEQEQSVQVGDPEPLEINLVLKANALGEAEVAFLVYDEHDTYSSIVRSLSIEPLTEELSTSLTAFWDGKTAYEEGRYSEAEKEFSKAILYGKNGADVYRERGMARHNMLTPAFFRSGEADYGASIARGNEEAAVFLDRGIIRVNQKKYESAIADFLKVIDMEPNNADALNRLGAAYEKTGQVEAAIASYSKAIEADRHYKLPYLNRGDIYRRLEDYELAIADFDRVITIDPAYAGAYNSRGLAKEELGREEEAIADYTKAIELDADHKWAYHNRGDLYRKRKDFQRAITDLNRAIAIDPDYTDAYNIRGLAYEGLEEKDAAIADFSKAIELDAGYKWGFNNRGDLYRKQEKYEEALADFAEAIKIDPSYASPYNNRGILNENLGNEEAAIEDFTNAIHADEQYKWAYRNRGELFRKREEFQAALQDLNQAIAIDPGYLSAYNSRGLVFESLGEQVAAEADFKAIIDKDGSYKYAYLNLGELFRKKKDFSTAIHYYTLALEQDEKYAASYNNRGFCYEEQGEYEKALADYSKTLEVDSEYIWAYGNRSRVLQQQNKIDLAEKELLQGLGKVKAKAYLLNELGTLYANSGRMQQARSAFEEAKAEYSIPLAQSPTYQDLINYGGVCQKLYQWQIAAETYSRAIELRPNTSEPYLQRGGCFLYLRRYHEAIADYQKVRELNPKELYGLYNQAVVYYMMEEFEKAVALCDEAAAIDPDNAYGLLIKSGALARLHRREQALKAAELGLSRVPGDSYALGLFASAMIWLGKYEEAIKASKEALDLSSGEIWILVTLGLAKMLTGRPEEAKRYFEESIERRPDPDFWENNIHTIEAVVEEHPESAAQAETFIHMYKNALSFYTL